MIKKHLTSFSKTFHQLKHHGKHINFGLCPRVNHNLSEHFRFKCLDFSKQFCHGLSNDWSDDIQSSGLVLFQSLLTNQWLSLRPFT